MLDAVEGFMIYIIIEEGHFVSLCDKFENGLTYEGEILHADPCRTCDGHELGQMSKGSSCGRKLYFENSVSVVAAI